MADKKITQLNQHTSLINSDLLAVVDVTASETKKLTASTLKDFTNQGLISSSAQIASDISGSFTLVSSSLASTIGSLSFDQLTDVEDYNSGTLTDGYHIEWNSSLGIWETKPSGFATGELRLFVAAARSNTNTFYFNSQTRTSDTSASPAADSAFLLTSNDLTNITVHLRSNTSVSAVIDILRNTDGTAFSTAAGISSPITQSLVADTVSSYTFTGLTLNQFDAIHIECTPGGAGDFYGIVEIS